MTRKIWRMTGKYKYLRYLETDPAGDNDAVSEHESQAISDGYIEVEPLVALPVAEFEAMVSASEGVLSALEDDRTARGDLETYRAAAKNGYPDMDREALLWGAYQDAGCALRSAIKSARATIAPFRKDGEMG